MKPTKFSSVFFYYTFLAKKRKLEEAAVNKAAPAMKKLILSRPAAGSGTKPIAVKKEVGTMSLTAKGPTTTTLASSATTVRDSKSDSSFFSAPKPKPRLPNFKKAPPTVKKEGADSNVAQPSSVDPFKDALAAMTRARNSPTPSAAVAAANAAYAAQMQGSQGGAAGATTTTAVENSDAMVITTEGSATAGATSMITATGKKVKKVSFKAEKDLVQIKYIEPAIYDDGGMGANVSCIFIKNGGPCTCMDGLTFFSSFLFSPYKNVISIMLYYFFLFALQMDNRVYIIMSEI